MGNDSDNRFELRIRFDSDNPERIARFLDLSSELGAKVVDLYATKEDGEREQRTLGTSMPDSPDSIGISYPNIYPTSFKQYCLDLGDLNLLWSNMVWDSLRYFQAKAGLTELTPYVNVPIVRDQVRRIEKGQIIMTKFGEKTWNVFAGLNNNNEPDPRNHILPWEMGVHSSLRRGPNSKIRKLAIMKLAEKYQQFLLSTAPTDES